MTETATELSARDADHLRLLSIGHFVLGGLATLGGFCPIFHLTLGIGMLTGTIRDGNDPAPPQFGWLFTVAGGFMMLALWTLGALLIVAGRSLRAQRRRTLCVVTAVLAGLVLQPVGTALGVFTILVLGRPAVREAFESDVAKPGGAPTRF